MATTADKTIEDINVAFDTLSAALVTAVEQRKQALTTEVQKAKEDGIASLQPFRDQIHCNLKANKQIVEGSNVEKAPRRKVSFVDGYARKIITITVGLQYFKHILTVYNTYYCIHT